MTGWPPSRIRAVKSALGLSYEALGREIDIQGRTVRSWVYESEKRQPGKFAMIGLTRLERRAKKQEAHMTHDQATAGRAAAWAAAWDDAGAAVRNARDAAWNAVQKKQDAHMTHDQAAAARSWADRAMTSGPPKGSPQGDRRGEVK